MKTKLSILIFCLCGAFFGYKYYLYKKECKLLINSMSKFESEHFNFHYFFSQSFKLNGELPTKSEVIDVIDQIVLNPETVSGYIIEINSINSNVEVYKKGNIKNSKPFHNIIKINYDQDYFKDFTFINYLYYGDFNLLIYDNKFK